MDLYSALERARPNALGRRVAYASERFSAVATSRIYSAWREPSGEIVVMLSHGGTNDPARRTAHEPIAHALSWTPTGEGVREKKTEASERARSMAKDRRAGKTLFFDMGRGRA
jgi:hypothetical protein